MNANYNGVQLSTAVVDFKKKTHYGIRLPVAVLQLGKYESLPDIVCVEGNAYYVDDFGGVWALFRWVEGQDYGGNVHHHRRYAPASLDGIAAPVCQGTIPCRAVYSEPKYWLETF